MKYFSLFVISLSVFIGGCATPLSVDKDYAKVAKYGYKKSQIIDMANCVVLSGDHGLPAICVITDEEFSYYAGKDFGDRVRADLVHKFKFSDMEKIAIKRIARIREVIIHSPNAYFGFQLSNGMFVDIDRTENWFNHLLSSGVKEYEIKNPTVWR